MVPQLKKLKIFKLILCLVFVYISCLCIKTLFNHASEECVPEEPIDVVYTWVNGSDPLFLNNLKLTGNLSEYAYQLNAKRYDDKYELKFSLRSLEKFAPWVNHVYIVTNGQIPYWLNLDYKKVSIVTHKEIFRSSHNLPSFSSPAIESNLHRIPGLSKKFIYFNDDIFLGRKTYREDFYTKNGGYQIYLSYPIRKCSEECYWSFVGDGECDRACYKPKCQMDGGDCDFQPPTAENSEDDEDDGFSSLNNSRKYTLLEQHYKKIRAQMMKGFNSTTNEYKNETSVTTLPSTTTKYSIKRLLFEKQGGVVKAVVESHNRKIIKQSKRRSKKYTVQNSNGQDTYSESLQHTHRVFNSKYGFKPRNVPAHAPILIDKDIMSDLQRVFSKEFFRTEMNKIRGVDDMQFGFSYYYFLMNEMNNRTIGQIFDIIDTDGSGTWSDREIRTLLTKIYELPLSYGIVDHFETMLLNCTEKLQVPDVTVPPFERYIDSRLPTISKELITRCPEISKILSQRFGEVNKYRYTIVNHADTDHVAFVMLHSNVTEVVTHLDEIRKRPKKFICLNDDLSWKQKEENELVKSILYDFYLSLFPHPSKFELAEDFRNKFTYTDELERWKRHNFYVNVAILCAICVLVYLSCLNACKKLLCNYVNKMFC